MIYVKLKDVLSILDTVSSDEGIRRKCKAIRKRLKELPTKNIGKGKPVEKFPFDVCPVCGTGVNIFNKYCYECGLELDWSDNK